MEKVETAAEDDSGKSVYHGFIFPFGLLAARLSLQRESS